MSKNSAKHKLVNETLELETRLRPRRLKFCPRRDQDDQNQVSRPRRRDRDFMPVNKWQNGPTNQQGARSRPSDSASVYSEITDLMLALTLTLTLTFLYYVHCTAQINLSFQYSNIVASY